MHKSFEMAHTLYLRRGRAGTKFKTLVLDQKFLLFQVGSLSSTSFEGKPLLLDSFFPFDPYSLPESKVFVEESYRFYKEDDEDDDDSDNEEEMDLQVGHKLGNTLQILAIWFSNSGWFLQETAGPQSDRDDLMSELVGSPQQLLRTKHDKMAEFLYGTSPGFKSKSPT